VPVTVLGAQDTECSQQVLMVSRCNRTCGEGKVVEGSWLPDCFLHSDQVLTALPQGRGWTIPLLGGG
jgi:hypothetical protein